MRPRIAIAILFASVLVPALPRLVREVRMAEELRPLSWMARRERLNGDFYRSTIRLDRELPRDEPLAIVLGPETGPDFDSALFFDYYVYPRRTRIYKGLGDYRANILDPHRPRRIVHIDTARSAMARVMSYEEIREEEMIGAPVVREVSLTGDGHTSFFAPIAASLDGPPPDSYTTEGVIEAVRDTVVAITFYPSRERKEIALRAGQRRAFHDLVYECFRRMDSGWLGVEATTPVRAAFWFVNRGTKTASPLPLVGAPLVPPLTLRGSGKLWLLNASDADIEARVNGTPQHLGPRALLSLPSARENTIHAGAPLYAYLSERQADGDTRFIWP
jgi:hypothetical protein